MITWVIGSGGLLGSAVARQASKRFDPGPVPWGDPDQAADVLHQQARAFESAAGRTPWRVIWTAGAATTATPRELAIQELKPLGGLVSGLRSALPQGRGVFFLASSAGGVYAGAEGAPFAVTTPAHPLSPYGELKLEQEDLVSTTLGASLPVITGRLSNLYGPGQNLTKLQGIISRLALASVTRTPINIFVPLGTIRDYLFTEDAARAILALTDESRHEDPQAGFAPRVEVIASGRGTTLGQLVRAMNEIAKRRVPVALGSHPSATAQAPDLRLEPTTPIASVTPLPEGIKAVHADIVARLQAHPLAG